MAYEIDYIPVGDGEKCGDAITLRFGNLSGSREEQTVVVIDGGFKDSGEKLVQHVSKYYGTDFIDLVISTHSDEDHCSGLSVVLENCKVGCLFMHKPWEHASDIKSLFQNGKITSSGLEQRLERSLQNASDLESIAIKNKIQIIEPFQGETRFSGAVHILGPSQEDYEKLLPLFRSTPTPIDSLSKLIKRAGEEIIKWIDDKLDIDLLNDDNDTTSPENNTSTIVLFNIDGQKFLFTGDAGKTGLLSAIDYVNNLNIPLTDLNFFDVPHHGSKRNLSSKVLKNIKAKTAFISAPKNSSKHPARKITNALKKRDMRVFVNRESTLCHNEGGPDRGWAQATEEPFHNQVEE